MAPKGRSSREQQGSFLPYSWVHGAGKWVTAGVTTAAALLALLVNAQNLGLGAWLGSHGVGFADYAATRIVVLPRSDSLFAVGDTLPLAATVTDRHGAALVGPTIIWQSDDSAVATVDSSGAVVSRGPGSARITARVRQVIGGARVVVRPRVVRVAIGGDSLVRVAEGAETRLVAAALDARGFHVRDRRPAWGSADSTVAVVDGVGTVTARAPGHTTLTASADGLSASVALDVVMAPAAIALESGDSQRGPAGRRLPQPIVVRVTSRSGRPVPDATVHFRAEDGDASTDPAIGITDRAGRARTAWTPSGRPGRQRLMASVEGLDSLAVASVEADPVPRNTRVQAGGASGAMLAGSAGRALDQPVVVRASDSSGTALTDVPVAWIALDGGSVEAGAQRTDSLGEAQARWILGPNAGEQRLRVQVGNPRTIAPLVVRVAARSGVPRALRVVSGEGQRGGAGRELPRSVIVVATDSLGNPVPGAQVTGVASAGALPDSAMVADAAGRVSVRWTLGRSVGEQRLTLRLTQGGGEVQVVARADPLAAANVEFASPPESVIAGRPLPLVAVVTDGYGNPVSDAMVSFAAGSGGLDPGRVMSDARGKSLTRWTAPNREGAVTISASVRGTRLRASLTVQVVARRAGRRASR